MPNREDFGATLVRSTPDRESFGAKPTVVQGIGSRVGRQVGLTGRYAIEGALALPALAGDAVIGGINALAGTDITPTSEALSNTLTRAGLPQPETAQERVIGDVSRGMAGGAAFGPAAIVPGGVSAGASGTTREMGGGTGTQIAAGLAAPFAVEGMKQAVLAAYRGAKAVSQPFYQGGRERIAGDVLSRNAGDPVAARSALSEADDIVPGSQRTVVQVTRDPGLATVERGLRSSAPRAAARFSERDALQNRARTMLLNSFAKDKAALDAAYQARDEAALPLLNKIREGSAAVDASPVVSKIDDILAGEAGKRAAVKGALVDVKSNLYAEKDKLETSFSRLYGVRKDISDMIEGRVGSDKSSHRFAAKELIAIRDALDDQIQKVYPEFSEYRELFKEGSKTINQLKLGQEISQKTATSGTTHLGDQVISNAQWYRTVTQNKAELSKTLSESQMKTLEKIGKDLDAGSFASSGGKAVGSNTVQNASTAYLLGSMFGGSNTTAQTLFRPFGFVTKLQDQEINELLTEAMLDPRLARALMLKATPRNAEAAGKLLAQKAKELGLGAAAGTAAAQ